MRLLLVKTCDQHVVVVISQDQPAIMVVSCDHCGHIVTRSAWAPLLTESVTNSLTVHLTCERWKLKLAGTLKCTKSKRLHTEPDNNLNKRVGSTIVAGSCPVRGGGVVTHYNQRMMHHRRRRFVLYPRCLGRRLCWDGCSKLLK